MSAEEILNEYHITPETKNHNYDYLYKTMVKLIEDHQAINKCIREGGDLNKLKEERGIKFAIPI